ncbi:HNH endonuclease family protein [Kutzneria viridogrisea]|uniref:GmrSD restriction endonucleases C-terminal domain-containing protein n=2 Tax=Kutzneria TaxID=43356 RepID=W5W4K1_9PSEU|nr:HNH endonuclease family protein [Kutzneria albida]AHH95406.1 hypothetical protein KALB_2037 [Kutzneria albida DSM 43870]MBA8927235.1 hypothetical protein [Kutzneria viridogrisea]
MRARTWLIALAAVVVLAIAAFLTRTVVAPPTAQGTSPVQVQLAELPVKAQHAMKGYSRDRFKHWITQGGGCDTREVVIERDGKDVKKDAACKATSGHWTSPYDGKEVSKATELDIDHMVPLAAAWRTGADEWTDERRQQFANDLTAPQLFAVSAASNRGKGDQDPSQWKPPAKTYWCTYATNWVIVKHTYQLFVTQAEHDALVDMLSSCPG